MKKNFKRFSALMLCVALILGLTACHRANERALYIADEEFSAGFYSCALVFADMEGQQKVLETLGESAATDYLNQTLDGVDYKTWVKNRAIEKCKEFTVYKGVCEEAMIDTTKYADETLETADLYWDYYGYSEMMMENGVGKGTFRSYMSIDAYKNAYFDCLYAEGGVMEIPAEEIKTNLSENYAIADILIEDITGKDENDVKILTAKLESYANRISEGEKFDKIYYEDIGTQYLGSEEDKETFCFDLATIVGNENTSYEMDIFEDVSAMKNGEVKVVKKVNNEGTEEETATLYLLFKGDLLDEKNTLLENLKSEIRHTLKDEELQADVQKTMDTLTVEENTKVTKQFKVEKIYYPVG